VAAMRHDGMKVCMEEVFCYWRWRRREFTKAVPAV
jgi:hypothetical protein